MTFPEQIAALNERFAIPGIAQVSAGNGGLPKLRITTSAGSAEIYLHGAQVTSWQPAGEQEAIFLSRHSRWENGKAIRGGIPICFPWFRAKTDDPKAPAHGVVRTKGWRLESLSDEQDTVVVTLATESDEQTRSWWPYEFRLVHRIRVGAELTLELNVTNTGDGPFHFEEALHTYYRVGNVERLHIQGLDGAAFLDNRDENSRKQQAGDLVLTQATDNAYVDTEHAVEVVDPVLGRRICLEKQNSITTVAWNPWKDGAAALADLGDEEWQQFVCVEASNILAGGITLAAGAEHTMTATIRLVTS